MCIRDEERFLASHLAYHHALGVSKAYIYLDRCTDASADIAAAFPWVEAIERDRAPEDVYMSMHQVKCLDDALGRARADGIDWLMHIDADEFACGDDRHEAVRLLNRVTPLWSRPDPLVAGNLPAMLARVDPEAVQVVMRPKDVIPMVLPPGAPFWTLHYFHRAGDLERAILDPSAGTMRTLSRRIGHYSGKSIVRTRADVRAASAHRWQHASGPDLQADEAREDPDVPTIERGGMYHFTVVSGEHWWNKHRKFAEYPDHWEKGNPVYFPKQAWKEASVQMTRAEAEAYFAEWVALTPDELIGPMLRGHIVRETFVHDVMARLPREVHQIARLARS